jgi:AraC-like DNA-binding protein
MPQPTPGCHPPNFDANAFFSRMREGLHGMALWDALPDVHFWIKDAQGRFVWVNETLTLQARRPREDIIGKRDVDCFPNELASIYMHDDAEVLQYGTPLINKAELVMTPEGGVEWRQTTKVPVMDKQGHVMGTSGISRRMAKEVPLPPEYAALAQLIDHANRNLPNGIRVKDLAKTAHLSLSSLERYLQTHLHITPHELLLRIRMNRACHLLSNSTLNISEIAAQCGYESPSSFSRAFRLHKGSSPGTYRDQPAEPRLTPLN